MKIVIRAGGIGTRLWPVSRKNKPKQLHAFLSKKTLLQEAIERVLPLAQPQDIYVSCNKRSEKAVREQLGALLESNLIVEPYRKDTAAAICLESLMIQKKKPKAIIASLGSDHSIKKNKNFQNALRQGEKFLKKHPQYLLLIACQPTQPDTGYGYIKFGKKVGDNIFKVEKFKEKPSLALAKKYLATGNYLWNTNTFMWRVETILKLYQKLLPKMYKNIEKNYRQAEEISIDHAILEKAKNIAVLPADLGWSDIGDWSRLKDELVINEEENYIKAKSIDVDSKNCLIFSETDKLIATIGLKDTIIVVTEDAILVSDKYSSAKVKSLLKKIDKRYL